jgi:pimeloyl-ACP methyl ester carboxylesterase
LKSLINTSRGSLPRSVVRRAPGARAHWFIRLFPRLSALVLAELFVAPRTRVEPLRVPPGATSEQLRIGKRKVRVLTLGSGPLVVLIHGWEGGASQMLPMANGLVALGYRVAVFDMPAHGEAEGWSTGLHEFLQVLPQVAARFPSIHALVGHGLGGTAALLVAAQGLGAAGVVAVSPLPSIEFVLSRFARRFGLPVRCQEFLARRLEARCGLSRRDTTLSAITPRVPTLLVHDAFDRIVPVHHSRALRDCWRCTKLAETRGLGHFQVLSAPFVTQTIAGFLEGLAAVGQVKDIRGGSV